MFSFSLLYAEPVYEILVYRNKINITTENTIKSKGAQNIKDTKDNQPFKVTSYLIAPNTNYALVRVMPVNTDKDFFKILEDNKYCYLVSTLDVVNIYDPRTGGNKREGKIFPVKNLPADYYKIWFSTEK